MTTPFASVVMPAYNHEKFVGEAIASVLEQTWQDLELVIVNDGSTDRTGEVVRGFSDARIRYVEQPNAGAHAAINRGMSLARGQVKAIINSDDTYHRDRLQFLIERTRGKTSFVAFTNVVYVDGYGQPHTGRVRAWVDALEASFRDSGSVALTALAGNVAITTSNFFCSATALERIGPFRDFRYAHDYDFLLRAVSTHDVECLYFPDSPLLAYRLHGDNTVYENVARVNAETLAVLAEHAPRLADTPADAERMRVALGHAARTMAYVAGFPVWRFSQPLRKLSGQLRGLRAKYWRAPR